MPVTRLLAKATMMPTPAGDGFVSAPAYGHCEVICFSSEHAASFAELVAFLDCPWQEVKGVVLVVEILTNKSTYNTLELTSGRMAKVVEQELLLAQELELVRREIDHQQAVHPGSRPCASSSSKMSPPSAGAWSTRYARRATRSRRLPTACAAWWKPCAGSIRMRVIWPPKEAPKLVANWSAWLCAMW